MSDEITTSRPARRVTLEVTAYLANGVVQGGWYDMQSQPDGGARWSMPESVVDEATVRDAPPETLTPDDWEEIRGLLAARLGNAAAIRLAAKFESAAEDEERARLAESMNEMAVAASLDLAAPPPVDSITRLPFEERTTEIRRRFNVFAYTGMSPADRERDAVIAHLLGKLDAIQAGRSSCLTT